MEFFSSRCQGRIAAQRSVSVDDGSEKMLLVSCIEDENSPRACNNSPREFVEQNILIIQRILLGIYSRGLLITLK